MKTVFITGISKGLGRAIAMNFVSRGYRVIGISRDRPEDFDSYENIHWFPFDLSEPFNEERFKLLLCPYARQIDVVVLNAAMAIAKPFLEVSEQEISSMVQTNFVSFARLLQVMIPFMPAGSTAVCIGSSCEYIPAPRMALYAALKSAQSSLVMSLQVELKTYGIHFKLVKPGYMRTDFSRIGNQHCSFLFRIFSMTPECVAREVYRMVHSRGLVAHPGMISKLLHIANRVNRSVLMWLQEHLYNRKQSC